MSKHYDRNTDGIGGLMMTRKPGDVIIVNEGLLTIQVEWIRANQVRLAFKADRDKVRIRRAELEPPPTIQEDE